MLALCILVIVIIATNYSYHSHRHARILEICLDAVAHSTAIETHNRLHHHLLNNFCATIIRMIYCCYFG